MAVIECICDNGFQEALYGKRMRVHNRLQGQKKKGHRCTSCGNEKLTSMVAER